MMLEMIFGHKEFFQCEPRQYAKLKLFHVGRRAILEGRETRRRANATP